MMPFGDGDLVLDGTGLALLVDGQRHQRGAVLAASAVTFAKRDSGPSPSS